MLEFTTHNFPFLKRKEIWFYDGQAVKEEAYTVFSVSNLPSPANCSFHEKYQTVVIDLSKTENELLNEIHPTYRYDIRAAQKKGIISKLYLKPSAADCAELVKSYNLFAVEKKIAGFNERWLNALRKKGNILFSKAFFENNEIVTHVYIFDEETISLFSSFHNVNFTDNKIRSESNKFLHWEDILFSKKNGYKKYDWGGINPVKLPGISKFKLSFGGRQIESYRFIKTYGIFFKLAGLFKKIRN
ncbi:MAG: hypothetical protein ACXVC6_05065 [Bacteroidia bacterium]